MNDKCDCGTEAVAPGLEKDRHSSWCKLNNPPQKNEEQDEYSGWPYGFSGNWSDL